MNNTPRSVVVVGGGVIGASCAHFLQQAGWRVTILDRERFGAACSHANCGFICPSHVLPLAEPGAVTATLAAMLRPNAPFAVKPRFDPGLWAWLLRFALRCNERTMLRDGAALHTLLTSSRSLYDTLIKTEPLDCEWQTRGLLLAYRDRAAFAKHAEADHLLREHFQLAATRHDGDAVTDLEPALQSGLAGGWHYPGDAHLRPDKLMASWRRLLEGRGVVIREQCPVGGFVRTEGRATALLTAAGPLTADAFVLATGALTPLLAGELGCRIPIQPGKGYSITLARPTVCPALPMIFPETRVAVTPFANGFRLGSTMEFAGYDATIDPRRVSLLRDGAAPYLRCSTDGPAEEEWFGWRPMTVDSKPIIDRSPTLSNVVIAAGHNMLGLSLAPATGKLVAELLTGSPPHVDPAPYAITRF
jgi:D-amino-acid dehydrogenase